LDYLFSLRERLHQWCGYPHDTIEAVTRRES
jgi:hypothetical protein